MERRTMTVKEVATFLGVHSDTIYDLVRDEEIPHFRIRSKILFLPEVIEKWIQEQGK
ncbi:helix-turn-helix domain-containing protein [Oceanobacillus caeni]|uniref:DNA-binding protein n=1 Tax=Oceanobacillus caeni TaxID=405946 RepID=A0ABR5MGD0_9BACI|nr:MULTISPECIES: helix-turn-helix domain-containing protein [Bacillaceae]KPH71568.1 DNA-binding protein [Oceanobacillus caeni]MCR1834064.1 helix-turn-helix domain-containing protein [Oceanobacillus caeni]MED4476200.1 helix-turn-helix domain-containing protein [Oceanobacillus caeni]